MAKAGKNGQKAQKEQKGKSGKDGQKGEEQFDGEPSQVQEIEDTGRLLDMKQAASRLGISPRSAYRLKDLGELPVAAYGPVYGLRVKEYHVELYKARVEAQMEQGGAGPENEGGDAQAGAQGQEESHKFPYIEEMDLFRSDVEPSEDEG